MSLGEDRVRVKFNSSDNSTVAKIKHMTAAMIDLCDELHRNVADPEVKRLFALAMTEYESAQHWAVKGATA